MRFLSLKAEWIFLIVVHDGTDSDVVVRKFESCWNVGRLFVTCELCTRFYKRENIDYVDSGVIQALYSFLVSASEILSSMQSSPEP